MDLWPNGPLDVYFRQETYYAPGSVGQLTVTTDPKYPLCRQAVSKERAPNGRIIFISLSQLHESAK